MRSETNETKTENMEVNEMAETMKAVYDLADTAEAMTSDDYKERFMAEYAQTKIRYEKLKAFNTKIEAAERTSYVCGGSCGNKVEMPIHDCPADLLRQQQSVMGEYLHLLELRAVIEGIVL